MLSPQWPDKVGKALMIISLNVDAAHQTQAHAEATAMLEQAPRRV